jgi:hypothetical protein
MSTFGVPVAESEDLGYDEMSLDYSRSRLLVGEVRHFEWRMEQIRRNNECRRIAARRIELVAEEILGEPWTVGGNQ